MGNFDMVMCITSHLDVLFARIVSSRSVCQGHAVSCLDQCAYCFSSRALHHRQKVWRNRCGHGVDYRASVAGD